MRAKQQQHRSPSATPSGVSVTPPSMSLPPPPPFSFSGAAAGTGNGSSSSPSSPTHDNASDNNSTDSNAEEAKSASSASASASSSAVWMFPRFEAVDSSDADFDVSPTPAVPVVCEDRVNRRKKARPQRAYDLEPELDELVDDRLGIGEQDGREQSRGLLTTS